MKASSSFWITECVCIAEYTCISQKLFNGLKSIKIFQDVHICMFSFSSGNTFYCKLCYLLGIWGSIWWHAPSAYIVCVLYVAEHYTIDTIFPTCGNTPQSMKVSLNTHLHFSNFLPTLSFSHCISTPPPRPSLFYLLYFSLLYNLHDNPWVS